MKKQVASSSSEGITVRSVDRALDLLEMLMSMSEPINLVELSEKVNLHPATAHRLLATLVRHKFVFHDPVTKSYTLGTKLFYPVGGEQQAHRNLRNYAMPILREVTNESGEVSSLAVRSGNQAKYVAQVSSDRVVRMFVQEGALIPLHCTGVGKAILAYLDLDEVRHIIRNTGLKVYTQNTITDLTTLERILEDIRKFGYATDDEEREVGIRCLAAPVFAGDGNILGALSVSGPSGRVSHKRDKWFAEIVIRNATKLSERLGFSPAQESGSYEVVVA